MYHHIFFLAWLSWLLWESVFTCETQRKFLSVWVYFVVAGELKNHQECHIFLFLCNIQLQKWYKNKYAAFWGLCTCCWKKKNSIGWGELATQDMNVSARYIMIHFNTFQLHVYKTLNARDNIGAGMACIMFDFIVSEFNNWQWTFIL